MQHQWDAPHRDIGDNEIRFPIGKNELLVPYLVGQRGNSQSFKKAARGRIDRLIGENIIAYILSSSRN